MRPKPFLVVVLIGMLLVSACQGINTPAAYPNVTDTKSEKEAILQQAYAAADEYNAFVETENQTGNIIDFGGEYFLFKGESLKRAQQKETEVLNKIAELNEAYYQLTLQETSAGAYPNQQYAATREFKLAMGDFSGPSEEEWKNGTSVSIYSTQNGVYSRVAIGDLYLIVREDNILSATAQAKNEEAINSIPVPENIVQAIHRAAQGYMILEQDQMETIRKWREEVETKASRLTSREKEILILLAKGLDNKTISEQLGISCKTVAYHATSIFSKLSVQTRQEALIWAMKYLPNNPE
jgi:DNA-binding CsgD family transcriptional regulator